MSEDEEFPPCPDSEWYAEECQKRNSGPVCPFKNTKQCRHYAETLICSKYIEREHIVELKEFWNSHPMEGPLFGERGAYSKSFGYYNCCPEVLGEIFGLYTNHLQYPFSGSDVDDHHERNLEIGISELDLRYSFVNQVHSYPIGH